MPVTTSAKSTCPSTCPLKESGCYAKYSFLGNAWKKLSNGETKSAMNLDGLLFAIKRLPKGQLWRHNQAGDLPHNNDLIDLDALKGLVRANKGKKGFTYTHHKPTTEHNLQALKMANKEGFTVNLSADNLESSDNYKALGVPVVVILPLGADKVSYTPKGNKVVKCPANKDKGITCATCQLCAISDRDYIIGFEAHGTAKKRVEKIALAQA